MRGLTRNLIAGACAAGAWILASASVGFAHGGMASADDLGRPLGVSIALAFVCYWAVMLWPSRQSGGDGQLNRGRRPPQRRNRRITSGGGEERATTLRAVGRGRDV
jgi:hypothetical protein